MSARGLASLALSAFHLFAETTRVDAAATLSASVAPSAGVVTNLQDTDLNTIATWAAGDVAGLRLQWDFGGSSVDVTGIRLGSADASDTFLRYVQIQYSDDGATWTVATIAPYPDRSTFVLAAWPGTRALSLVDTTARWSKTDYSHIYGFTLSADQKTFQTPGSTAPGHIRAMTPRSSGIRQFEVKRDLVRSTSCEVGIRATSVISAATIGSDPLDWAYGNDGRKNNNNAKVAYGAQWNASETIGVVVNFTAGTITFYINGVSQGVAYTSATLIGREVCPVAGFSHTVASTDGFTLKCDGFTHPIAGAAPWGGDIIPLSDAWSEQTLFEGVRLVPTAGADANYSGVKYTPLIAGRTNYLYGGSGRIYGTTKIEGTPTDAPVSRRVRLYRDRDGMLVQEQWSAASTGAYLFQYVEMGHTYTVIAHDHTSTFRAVVADRVTPELML